MSQYLPLDEEKVESMAGKIVEDISQKIREDIAEKFYDTYSGYLYEHYKNADDMVKADLMSKLIGNYLAEPENHKYRNLRDKLFEEHKDEIVESLTDQAIKNTLAANLKYLTQKDTFAWQWKQGIADFLCANPELFLDDEVVSERVAVRMKAANETIARLQKQIDEQRW